MRLHRVWGILPVVALRSRDGWGHARGPVIWLPDDATAVLVAHELFHVKQFYALLALIVALICVPVGAGWPPAIGGAVAGVLALWWALSARSRYWREAAAYGESLRRLGTAAHAGYYARLLADDPHYDLSVTRDTARARILKRYSDGRLI